MQFVRQAFGNPEPPQVITQEAFDYDTKHLHRLARLRLGESADPVDLVDYCLDLTYEEVQTALFRWVFPFCLAAWRQELLGAAPQYGAFVENFYPALVHGKIFIEVTFDWERVAIARFFRETILEELDSQTQLRGIGSGAKPYRWMGAFATYGVLLPDIAALWEAWWPASTVGRALGVVQYASCLIYGERDNLIFPAWTPTEGGGPPELGGYEGFLYEDHWQEPNLAFLKTALTAETIGPALDRAVERLRESPELALAQQVQTDFACRMPLVRQRCAELLVRLGMCKIRLIVIAFVAEHTYTPVTKITLSTRLAEDLGVDGADAYELMTAFAALFQVDLTGFEFSRHFGPEASWNPLSSFFLKPLEPITIEDLIQMVESRVWHQKEERDGIHRA